MNADQKCRVLLISWVCMIIVDQINGLIEVTGKKKHLVQYYYPKRANTQTKSMLFDENIDIIRKVLERPKLTFQADIEIAIYTLVHSEIPKIKFIKGKSFVTLMKFLDVLVNLSPMKIDRNAWSKKLKRIMDTSMGMMFGVMFRDLIYSQEVSLGKLISADDFVECRRSAAYPRGFSCALWHLFHYLTVQASLSKPHKYKPGIVLNIIASFIRYFFPSCPECSRTFQQIAEDRKIHEVRDYDDEILWLWEAHNEINRHLAGGKLEDPLFPKKPFPTEKGCPDCKTNGVWDRKRVLAYLKDIYSTEKLSKLNLVPKNNVTEPKVDPKKPMGKDETDTGNSTITKEVSNGKRSRGRHSHRRSRGKRSADCAFGNSRLYSPLDNVEVLTNDTQKAILGAPDFAKLVQFMNIFCEDCRRYAPTFKKLARQMAKWKPILHIYVVDCAQEESQEMCRDYDMETPTIRFYPPNFSMERDGLGINMTQTKPNKLIEEVRGHLVKQNYSGGRVNFNPVGPNESLTEIFKSSGNNTYDNVALVSQKKDSLVGKQTAIDLLPFPNIGVRMVEVPKVMANFKVDPIKVKMVVLDQLGTPQIVSLKGNSDDYVKQISNFLEFGGHTPLPTLPTTVAPSENENFVNQAISERIISGPLKIYRADLEQAIDKLLHIELPKMPVIEGDKLHSLINITNLLSSFNPLNQNGRKLLEKLNRYLKEVTKISGDELTQKINLIESQGGKIFNAQRYVGCLKPTLSAFNCSLWTIFHHLTVEAAKNPKKFRPGSVLWTLLGFVKHFFGCAECARHFEEMAKRRHMESVKTHSDEILWLWAAHNEVNKRLADDLSEDPRFPKIQFPSSKDCPSCRNQKNDFIESEVLKFLKGIYDISHVSSYGLPSTNGYVQKKMYVSNANKNLNDVIIELRGKPKKRKDNI
ncbi:sulfhydryl oxidase 1-like [Drosophila ananassae]|uniref:sulfhydryl oxidase 1-like n=1 Tax=Drosophila ananassae TaxID=7217 RepID=UPI001CFF5C34|nr:sulfhydryl oxidase 1-like [Drosophila ananassae]